MVSYDISVSAELIIDYVCEINLLITTSSSSDITFHSPSQCSLLTQLRIGSFLTSSLQESELKVKAWFNDKFKLFFQNICNKNFQSHANIQRNHKQAAILCTEFSQQFCVQSFLSNFVYRVFSTILFCSLTTKSSFFLFHQ